MAASLAPRMDLDDTPTLDGAREILRRTFGHADFRGRQAEVIAISDDEQLLANARVPLALPAPVPEWLSPITAIVPGQLLAMHLAHARDFDIDSPRGIRKVTETV